MVERDRRLGERLAQLRRRRGMTQEVLAERSGVSVSVIHKLEQGERDSVGLSTVRKFASALGVPTMELFAPEPAFAGPVDEDERDDLYELRRVLQPPRGINGVGVVFNETRRVESVKAHAALGGRLVHGCQSVPDMSGGACVPYGASITRFREDLRAFRSEWLAAVNACRQD